jgi:hypothetical protein
MKYLNTLIISCIGTTSQLKNSFKLFYENMGEKYLLADKITADTVYDFPRFYLTKHTIFCYA